MSAALALGPGALAAHAFTDPESTPPAAAARPAGTTPMPSFRAAGPEQNLNAPIAGGIAGVDLNIEISRFAGGASNSNIVVPDTMASVGPNHIVETINGNFEIFDKATGASLEARSPISFWSNRVGLTITAGRIFDPRVVYDPASQRWFTLGIDDAIDADDNGVNEQANNLYLARSDTSDPTGDWDGFMIDADTVGVEEFHDYPTLGVDADGVYSCTQDFDGPGNETCYSFPKADLLAAVPTFANMTRFEASPAGLAAVSGSWQPAVDFGASDGRAALLGATGAALRRTSILGAGGAGATLAADVAIAGDPGHAPPPDARQPLDSVGELHRIENVAPRFVGNVFELGNSLWAVHSVMGTAANAALRWYEINETTNTVIQTGLIEDTNRDFIDPSLAVNAHGDVVIGYTCSGQALGASVCISLGTTSAGVTTFQAPIVQTTGAGPYFQDGGTDRNRWGDYSATVIDPVNPCTFWTFQEYVAVAGTGDLGPDDPTESASGAWGIRAVELTFQQCQIDTGLRDFGDLPDTYGTLLASNGARHTEIFGAPVLGSTLDVEANGQPTAGATGDDTNVIDDEDGVVLPANLIAGVPQSVTVTASAAGGRLDAFIDFNGNGTFEAGERIANSLVLAAGPNTVTFTAPATSTSGLTGARFRISTTGGLGATGAAADGEVEDYVVTIISLEAFCAGAPPPGAIVGTAGHDVIEGTAGDDVIFGLVGNDTIRGLGGNDILCGNDGNDALSGGDGADGIVGANGNDRLDGGDGDDTMFGGPGNDFLDGRTGTNFNDGGTESDFCLNPGGGPGCP